jgi:hypothetical protein
VDTPHGVASPPFCKSVAASALHAAKEITLRKYDGAKVMESVLSFAFPNASMWPFIALNGYSHTSREVASLASAGSMGLVALVNPGSEATAFEKHVQEHYAKQGYPEDAGASAFGFGIYKMDPNSTYPDHRIPSLTGNDTNYDEKDDSQYRRDHTILAPMFDHSVCLVGLPRSNWVDRCFASVV